MKRVNILLFVVVCFLAGIIVTLVTKNYYTPKTVKHYFYQDNQTTQIPKKIITPTLQPKKPGTSTIIPMRTHAFQTFNNCGPASLSMLMSYSDINISQQELGMRLRPYQNQNGDNDDKSVTLEEMAEEAKQYDLIPYHRPSGSLELLKLFIANDIPVVVRTWLHPGEDIGHYRLVRGYDDSTQEIVQDDSFEGKDMRFSYNTFLSMWQPFNYEFLIAVRPDTDELAKNILKEYTDEKTAWRYAYDMALDEAGKNPNDFYPIFNQSIALFYLGDYEKSIQIFESIQNRLPARMLWYQTEPAEAYLQTKQYDKLFQLTDQMLINNRAFSEIYLMRGIVYKQQGNTELAKQEFEKALYYNEGDQMKEKVAAAQSNSLSSPAASMGAQP